MEDDAFRSEFAKILDPTQGEKLDASLAEQDAKKAEQSDTRIISNLPAIELSIVDETATSAKKLTTGLKNMMKGVDGLLDIGPMTDQQEQRRNGRSGE